MHRNIWLVIAKEVGRIAVTAFLAVFIFLQFFYRPIVVVSLKDLEAYQKKLILNMKEEDAAVEVARFFERVARDIQDRKEIVLVKEAVLNTDRVVDITEDLKEKNQNVKK